MLLVENKQVVIPGDILAEGIDYLPAEGTFREGNNIIAMQLGLVNITGRVIKIIPLRGRYIPKRNDVVIGKVIDMAQSTWFVDIGYAYEAVLPVKEATSAYIEKGTSLSSMLSYGQWIIAKITNVTKEKVVEITMKGVGLRKLTGGTIVQITPTKVPRIVGKQASMINLIKKYTNCSIYVGQNGRVWLSGKPEMEKLARDAIYLIEEQSHMSGLTEKVEALLKSSIENLPGEIKK